MPRTLQFKRYANTAVANTTGANGELIIDTTNHIVTIHDGVTKGGWISGGTDTTSRTLANAAFNQANTATALAQGAFNQGNTEAQFTFANAAFNQANTANVLAQSGYDFANTINVISSGINTTQNTWISSNAAYSISAYAQANTAAQTVPQNAQTTNYILQLSDAGKHIYYTQSSNTILYIPTTSNVAFSNGTTIMIVSKTSSSANVTVSPNTGVSMFLAGNTTSASRNVTTYGMATLIQVAANTWFISGTGVV